MFAFYRHEPIYLVIEHDGVKISMLKIIPEEKYLQHQALELSDKFTNKIKEALDAYFSGKDSLGELAFELNGTDFELNVWNKTRDIPFGKTISYAELASAIDNPDAARAVGNALNKNPILLIIPCHRVIGSDGELHGFGGGLENKKWLLEHESSYAGKQ
jgi:methylated-DNA-[protein]-cysteine S-methyltransferase